MKNLVSRLIAFAFLMIAQMGCVKTDYDIAHGYDFATGENVEVKRDIPEGGKDRKISWEKRREGVSELYKKYGLSHSEPIIVLVCGTEYYRGKAIAWDSFLSDFHFFDLLKNDGLPQEGVKAIFDHSIAVRKKLGELPVHEQVSALKELFEYQQREGDRLNAPRLKKGLDAFFEDPDSNSRMMDIGREAYYSDDWRNEYIRYFFEHRADFPEVLPDPFYQYVLKEGRGFAPGDLAKFCCNEYQSHPTDMNAFLAAYANLSYHSELDDEKMNERMTAEITQNSFTFRHICWYLYNVFKTYQKTGMLEAFLETIMPEDLLPVMQENRARMFASDAVSSEVTESYEFREFSTMPHGEEFFLLIANAKMLNAHFREKFEERYRERVRQNDK